MLNSFKSAETDWSILTLDQSQHEINSVIF